MLAQKEVLKFVYPSLCFQLSKKVERQIIVTTVWEFWCFPAALHVTTSLFQLSGLYLPVFAWLGFVSWNATEVASARS